MATKQSPIPSGFGAETATTGAGCGGRALLSLSEDTVHCMRVVIWILL
jgi:hypothetical protein